MSNLWCLLDFIKSQFPSQDMPCSPNITIPFYSVQYNRSPITSCCLEEHPEQQTPRILHLIKSSSFETIAFRICSWPSKASLQTARWCPGVHLLLIPLATAVSCDPEPLLPAETGQCCACFHPVDDQWYDPGWNCRCGSSLTCPWFPPVGEGEKEVCFFFYQDYPGAIICIWL